MGFDILRGRLERRRSGGDCHRVLGRRCWQRWWRLDSRTCAFLRHLRTKTHPRPHSCHGAFSTGCRRFFLDRRCRPHGPHYRGCAFARRSDGRAGRRRCALRPSSLARLLRERTAQHAHRNSGVRHAGGRNWGDARDGRASRKITRRARLHRRTLPAGWTRSRARSLVVLLWSGDRQFVPAQCRRL